MGPQNITIIRWNEWPIFSFIWIFFHLFFLSSSTEKSELNVAHPKERCIGIWETLRVKFFLECLEVPLVHWQVFLSIFRVCVGLDFVKVIVLATTYLGSWRFVAPIFTSIFLQDSHPFLLGAIGTTSSSPAQFQTHFRWAHNFLLPTIQTFIPSFEQFSKRKANCLQKKTS